MLVTRLQMGLLIFSFEGKVDRQMAENDAVGREQLRLRRPHREPTPSFYCISTPEVKPAERKRNEAHSGTNTLNPDPIIGAIKSELQHLCDPGEIHRAAASRRRLLYLMVFTDCAEVSAIIKVPSLIFAFCVQTHLNTSHSDVMANLTSPL